VAATNTLAADPGRPSETKQRHGLQWPDRPPASGLELPPKLASPTNKPPANGRPLSDTPAPAGEADSTFHLIQRYRAGDREALELLFARHLPRLRRWAKGRLPRWARSSADTEDLVQETLLKTFNHIEGFEPTREGALQAYLRQAVMNRIRDEIRRKGRRPERAELEGTEIVDPARSPLEEAIGLEEIERYENALGRLRPEEREAIILRVELGYTYEEVARLLEKPTSGAAHKATKRALVRLAEEMAHGG
jgi:RNA polymerase sigma factor (sigma-70 family)